MADRLKRMLRGTSGSTATEYALVATLIAVALVGAFNLLADAQRGSYGSWSGKILTAIGL